MGKKWHLCGRLVVMIRDEFVKHLAQSLMQCKHLVKVIINERKWDLRSDVS